MSELSGNRFKRYILYALGEIILVVIGILIAVSINNWNEAQKEKQQMVIDIEKLQKVINYNESTRPLYDKILRETKPDEPIIDCENCSYILLGNLNVANSDPKVIILISDANLAEDNISNRLRQIEALYVNDINVLEILEASILEKLKENMNYLSEGNSWFAQYMANSNCNVECQKYFSEDPQYRNMIASFELLVMKAYDSELKGFKTGLDEQLKELEFVLQEA